MSNTNERLKSFVERIERMEAEKAERSADIKDIYTEAKATGFDVKTIRKLVSLRKMSPEKYKEEMMLLETYASAIQMELFA